MKKRFIACALAISGLAHANEDARQALNAQWDMLDRHCVQCHNYEDWAGGLVLEDLGPDSLAEHGEVFQEVIDKVATGMMPPPNQDAPAVEERQAFVRALEGGLDAVVAEAPSPGSVVLHRLNRTEYANAVKDLLELDIEPELLLPRDDESGGFDNNAQVLKVSPSFLEQYMMAAREVSILALGDPDAAATGSIYPGAPDARQNVHIDGLPLGTRGGMVIEHHFPADGEYEFSINGLVGGGYVWGVMDPETLIITIDDEKVFEAVLGDRHDLDAVDLRQAEGIAEINERFSKIRRFVSAGPHRIGVTFLAKSAAEHNELLHSWVPVEGMSVQVQGVSDGPRIDNLEIWGPYNPRGVGSTPSREHIFSCYPQSAAEEDPCAREILGSLARRAFRRPVSERDLAGALTFYEQGKALDGFEAGIQKGLMAILASPNFLYRAHTPPGDLAPGQPFLISELELASRLAFFLWSGPPDDELLALAEQQQLREPGVLEAQVARMLADPRARQLVTNFAFQWFHVDGIDQVDPDKNLYPQFTADLKRHFRTELELFMASLFEADRPVTELLSASHTYLNERLALHYGLHGIRGGQFRRVELDDPQRFGLLGKGALLMATSYANRTSPVIRGAYILDKLIGVPAPAPPPDVEAFPETEEGGEQLTVRERLESHRANPACNNCHAVIDPLGLALENYNAIGQWRDRDRDAGVAIDASGRLTDGTPLSSPRDLREALLAEPERFVRTFTERLLTFALARELSWRDMPLVRAIAREAAAEDYRLSAIIQGIVESDAFQMDIYQTGEDPAEGNLVSSRAGE